MARNTVLGSSNNMFKPGFIASEHNKGINCSIFKDIGRKIRWAVRAEWGSICYRFQMLYDDTLSF